ncbi:MAG: ATP-binding cassette domain-containing protein, partial [Armatimonadota bacterium]
MLTLDKITKGFGPQTVLKDISLVVGNKERVGVVGVNGAGKSTLVKIMGKQLEPDKGVVDTHAASVGYLSQESQCRLGVTIGEEMRSVLPSVTDVEQRLEAHTLDARIGRVLSGLGFELDAVDRLTDTYSKGWQMRIVMAKLLVQEPDYLLLDEPTSHLDITARSWLMHEFIPSYPGTV